MAPSGPAYPMPTMRLTSMNSCRAGFASTSAQYKLQPPTEVRCDCSGPWPGTYTKRYIDRQCSPLQRPLLSALAITWPGCHAPLPLEKVPLAIKRYCRSGGSGGRCAAVGWKRGRRQLNRTCATTEVGEHPAGGWSSANKCLWSGLWSAMPALEPKICTPVHYAPLTAVNRPVRASTPGTTSS